MMTQTEIQPLASRLKQETRKHHAAVEQRVDVMRPDLSLQDYSRLLQRFYGFYWPLELQLDQVPGIEQVCPDYSQRRKVALLRADLRALGLDEAAMAALPACDHTPAPEDAIAALGVLYVTEGATLGGAIISRHVAARLGRNADDGCAFFTSYGEERGPMWRRFVACLGGVEGPCADRVISFAQQTFVAFEQWLRKEHIDGPKSLF